MLATGSPINHNLALHPRQHPSRSYVLGFEVPKVWHQPGTHPADLGILRSRSCLNARGCTRARVGRGSNDVRVVC